MDDISVDAATATAWMFGCRTVRPIDLLHASADSSLPSGFALARHGVTEERLIDLRRSQQPTESAPVLDLYRGSIGDDALKLLAADRPTIWLPTHDAWLAVDVVLCPDQAVQTALDALVTDRPALVADLYRAVDAPREEALAMRRPPWNISVYRRAGRTYLLSHAVEAGLIMPHWGTPVIIDHTPPAGELGMIVLDALRAAARNEAVDGRPVHECLGFKTVAGFMKGTRLVHLAAHDATVGFTPLQRDGTKGFTGLNVNSLRAPIDRPATIGMTLLRALDLSAG